MHLIECKIQIIFSLLDQILKECTIITVVSSIFCLMERDSFSTHSEIEKNIHNKAGKVCFKFISINYNFDFCHRARDVRTVHFFSKALTGNCQLLVSEVPNTLTFHGGTLSLNFSFTISIIDNRWL